MTLRAEGCFSDVAAEMKELAGRRPIVEIVNTGNWGDALIHAGQAQFLREIGVRPWRFSIHRLLSMGRVKLAILAHVLAPHAFVTGDGAYTDWYARRRVLSPGSAVCRGAEECLAQDGRGAVNTPVGRRRRRRVGGVAGISQR